MTETLQTELPITLDEPTTVNIYDRMSEEDYERIRTRYKEYLIDEHGEDYSSGNGFGEDSINPVPFIDRTEKEKQELRDRYAKWDWEPDMLESYLVVYPAFSDPNFTGVFVEESTPISNPKVREWFSKLVTVFRESASEHAQDAINYLEETGIVNNHYTGEYNGRQGLAGWTLAITTLNEAQLARQASTELRIQVEETQLAAEVVNALHDKALDMRKLASEMYDLEGIYAAILLGRRIMDVEYQYTDGSFIHQNWFIDKINTPSARRFLEEQHKESERIKENYLKKEAEEFDAWKKTLMEYKDKWENDFGLPWGALYADSEGEEHF